MFLKKAIKPIIIILGIIVIIAALAIIIILGIKTIKSGFDKTSNCWSMWGYIFGIIGSVATAAAVIVALFKEDIINNIHSPELVLDDYPNNKIPLVKVAGKKEDESYYKCELKVNNNGSENAKDCTLVISRFMYDKNRLGPGYFNELDQNLIERVQEIGDKKNQIVSGLDSRIELFKINNPSLSSTPNGGLENKTLINFTGVRLSEEIAAESNFEIDYEIRSNNHKPIKFRLIVNWPGKWNNTVTEMSNIIKISIQR